MSDPGDLSPRASTAPAGSPMRSPRKTWPSPATTGAPMTAAAASAQARQEQTGATITAAIARPKARQENTGGMVTPAA